MFWFWCSNIDYRYIFLKHTYISYLSRKWMCHPKSYGKIYILWVSSIFKWVIHCSWWKARIPVCDPRNSLYNRLFAMVFHLDQWESQSTMAYARPSPFSSPSCRVGSTSNSAAFEKHGCISSHHRKQNDKIHFNQSGFFSNMFSIECTYQHMCGEFRH